MRCPDQTDNSAYMLGSIHENNNRLICMHIVIFFLFGYTLDFEFAPLLFLQEWKCFQIWMVFPVLPGKLIIFLIAHKLCFKNWKKSNHDHFFFCLQVHIGFCILAAVAPPIVFKGKSLTYVDFIYIHSV